MGIIVRKSCLTVIVFILIINFVLEYQYIHYLSEIYDYMGYTYDFNVVKYIIGKIFLAIFLVFTLFLYSTSRFIYAITVFLILFFFIPASIFFSFKNIAATQLVCTIIFITLFILIAPSKFRVKMVNMNYRSLDIIVIAAVIICFIPIVLLGTSQINLNTLLLKDIYETRALHKQNESALYNYMFSWEIKILLPMMLVFSFFRKKYFYVALSMILLLYLYTISAHKSVYISLIALVMFYFLGYDYVSKTYKFLGYLVVLILLVLPSAWFFFGSTSLHMMLYERIFFDQSLTGYFYFDFFKDNPIYFSESHLFNLFFTYPFSQGSAYLIASIYLHNPLQHANTGILGDAYMNLGYMGVVIISTLFAGAFAFINSLKIDSKYFGIFFIFLFDFLNNSFLSTLLGGGFALLILFAYLVMSKKENPEIRPA